MDNIKPDIVVIGGADTDCLTKGDRFPQPGESVTGTHFQCAPGGKGVNQAIAAARLGAKVALIAMLGNDKRGEEILARLAAEGVNTRFVLRTANAPTGATLIMADGNGKTMRMAVPGANRLLLPEELEVADTLISSAAMVMAQLEVPLPAVRHAFSIARQAQVRTMLDASPVTVLDDEMLALADIIRANTSEAQAVTGIAITDTHSATNAAQSLLARGASMVALENGDGGNLVLASDRLHAFPPIPVDPTDRTGAGDAFAAAFAVALLEQQDPERAGWRANASAAYATTWLGALAGLPSRAELDAFIASHH